MNPNANVHPAYALLGDTGSSRGKGFRAMTKQKKKHQGRQQPPGAGYQTSATFSDSSSKEEMPTAYNEIGYSTSSGGGGGDYWSSNDNNGEAGGGAQFQYSITTTGTSEYSSDDNSMPDFGSILS